MILTEDFQTALAIGHSQDVTLKSVTEQLQQLNNEVALLRSENSSLGMFLFQNLIVSILIVGY